MITSRITIYFENERLRKNLEAYAQKNGKSFSETVLEFAGVGFSLLQKTGSVNLDRLIEKIKRLDEAKKEIEFLRGIVRSNTNQISKLLGAEEAPTHKINRRTESGNRISDSAQEDKDLTRNIRLE